MNPPAPTPFRVLVLTCSAHGFETAGALHRLPGIEVAALVVAPHRKGSLRSRVRRVWRTKGVAGFVRIAARKLARRFRGDPDAGPTSTPYPVLRVVDFHHPACLEAMAALRPDLGVVDGTYILRESVFSLPRLGCINLHCGRVPEYRGMPPAFWELYDGVPEVGVTIHQVTAKLDEGPVFSEASFPIELAPARDALDYVRQFWREVLRPNGIRMITGVVSALARGTPVSRPQAHVPGIKARREPSLHDVAELRRRVRQRRLAQRHARRAIRHP